MSTKDQEILLDDAYVAGYNDGWLDRPSSPPEANPSIYYREYLRGRDQGITERLAVDEALAEESGEPF